MLYYGLPWWLSSENPSANAEDLIPGLGRSPEKGNGNPLQYSSLEIPWTEEPGREILHGVGKEMDVTERLSMHTGGTAATFHVLSS